MHDLSPLTALGGTAPRIDSHDGLRISECPGWALASAAARLGHREEMRAAAQAFLGTALPGPGESAAGETFAVFWTGPDQWMIEAPYHSHERLADAIASALGATASVSEQSDGWVRFDLEGPRCCDVLERLCGANARKMAADAVTRTKIDHLGCFLICRVTAVHFSVLGPRSSAKSLHHALTTAASSVL